MTTANSGPERPPGSETLRRLLRTASKVVFFTGAGISAESGVPTFRSEDGLWKKFRPEELANVEAFLRNPDLVWEWYCHRRELMGRVQPNPGHMAIAAAQSRFASCVVVTQNVDGLHRRAGSMVVHELHGNIDRNYCIACRRNATPEEIATLQTAPRCVACGGLVRPDVVWFGEMLPEDAWAASEAAALDAELFFAVGTSGVVYPAAMLPQIARRAGAYLVEVNTERTDLSPMADEVLLGKSGEILPGLLSHQA